MNVSNQSLRKNVRLTRLLRVALACFSWLLVAFHGVLLGQRLLAGEMWDGAVLARYGVSALLLAGLFLLRHHGHSVLWGRRALVLWLAIFLLHAVAMVPAGLDAFDRDLIDPVWWSALPAGALILALVAAVLAGRLAAEALRLDARRGWLAAPSFVVPSTRQRRAIRRRGPPALSLN